MLWLRWGCGRALLDEPGVGAELDVEEGAAGEDALSREVAYSFCAKLWGGPGDPCRAGASWAAALYGGTAGFIRPMEASIVIELDAFGTPIDTGCTRDDLGGLPSCT